MINVHRTNRQEKPTFAQKLNLGVGRGLDIASDLMRSSEQKKLMQQENEASKRLGIDLTGIQDPKLRQEAVKYALQGQMKENLLNKKQEFLGNVFGGNRSESGMNEDQGQSNQQRGGFDPTQISDEQIAQASAIDPNVGRAIAQAKDVALREKREQQKQERGQFESDRKFHSEFAKKAIEEVEGLRSSLPKLEASLDFARSAVESGDVGAFSLANLGERLGIPELQTAKGAQLVTAAKENLLGNMSRVSSRAQNKWFEQRLNSMMAKVGQSEEANLSSQEMLEGEVALNQAYVNEFDRLAEEDMKNFGFERKDIAKRARSATKPMENHIFNRTNYRLKEIEEVEKGLGGLKKQVGKNVVKGTPLTLAMAKLYKDKFGDNALSVAQKNGYSIPTLEEFKSYEQRPREFRQEL